LTASWVAFWATGGVFGITFILVSGTLTLISVSFPLLSLRMAVFSTSSVTGTDLWVAFTAVVQPVSFDDELKKIRSAFMDALKDVQVAKAEVSAAKAELEKAKPEEKKDKELKVAKTEEKEAEAEKSEAKVELKEAKVEEKAATPAEKPIK
jgi:uncharacterized protein (DUF3084 family)